MLLACTRFTTETYNENRKYRQKINCPVIYGTPFRLREKYINNGWAYVLEMNNDTNCLEGIGLIRTMRTVNRSHRIHANADYNCNIYEGRKWIGREAIEHNDAELLEQLELMLFYGRSHMKRMVGITVLSQSVFYQWQFDKDRIMKCIIRLLPPPAKAMPCYIQQRSNYFLDNSLNDKLVWG